MKSMKKGLAVLLTALLLIPNIMSVSAEEPDTQEPVIAVESQQSTGENASSDENYEEQTVEESTDTEENQTNEEQSGPEEDSEEDKIDNEQSGSGEESSDSEEDETDGEQAGEDSNDLEEAETDEDELEEDEEELESEEESDSEEAVVTDEVLFNTGNRVLSIVNKEAFEAGTGYGCFEEDGSYTIDIPDLNPFFPYEVQFTYQGEASNQWFMTPDDSVEVGGHIFYVEAEFDGTAVTQMSLNVAGDTVIVYPEEKEFTDNGGIATVSLLPLSEQNLTVDLESYTPAELTMVSVSDIFKGTTALTDKDKVVWEYSSDDGEYTINASGDKLDLSYRTYSPSHDYAEDFYYTQWQMIVGAADQLAADNIRYIVKMKVRPSREWLISSVYTQDAEGNRTNLPTTSTGGYDDYWTDRTLRTLSIYVPSSEMGNETQAYVSLDINSSVFSTKIFDDIKVYEGQYTSSEEAVKGTDITNQIRSTDMTQADAGYLLTRYVYSWVTMVTYKDGNPTGCLPIRLYLGSSGGGSSYIYVSSLYEKTESGSMSSSVGTFSSGNTVYANESRDFTYTLYEEYPANGTYYLYLNYNKEGSYTSGSSEITAAYAGDYSSIADAESKGATEISAKLFSSSSSTGYYGADYSNGVDFTVFVGGDGDEDQEVYHLSVKTEEGSTSKYQTSLSSSTLVQFTGLKDKDGNVIPSYAVDTGRDSYGEFNYLTILVNDGVDLSDVAPTFQIYDDGIKLYAPGSDKAEVSGVSTHDFTKGPVHYTASAEDKKNSRNYWLQIVGATSGEGQLYINSLADSSSETTTSGGVIYSTREVMLDSYHDNKHDILLANMGTVSIANLLVELDSDTLVLDDYWTLNGASSLSGFKGVEEQYSTEHGELSNLALIRLCAKNSAEASVDAKGTLTIKSGDKTLILLTLTGTIGNPSITTEEVPAAVKYVPYGTMIQNNNKYSWNKVSYSLVSGSLPEGMEVQTNGELYGVPKDKSNTEQDFTFTVRMTNSYSGFSSSQRTYTLTVLDNTNTNVDAATDEYYELTERVVDIIMTSTGDQLLVSEGDFDEFQFLYLDGEKLTEGTDFTRKRGSTRITISNQTLAVSTGRHTLGIEFRTAGDKELRRAAQNYEVKDNQNSSGSSSSGNTGSDSGSSGLNGSGTGSGSGSSGSGNGGNASAGSNAGSGVVSTGNTRSSNATISTVDGTAEVVEYTVEAGDTLWKIAQKYYGSGTYWTKLYADNADTISNPDKIYVGQKIKIYPIQGIATTSGATGAEGTYYTVVSGDNLYKIAQKFYGKGRQWKKIYNANEDIIAKPERIYVGQVIFIPEE